MSIYDKSIKNVAEVAAKIMDEALKGNQHKIDANKNNKIDSHDFKLLRAGKKPEQVKEEIDLQEKSDDYEVKQSKTDPDVHHVHYKGKKIGYVYGNKKDMWGHEYHAMGTGDDGHSSKREAVSALKADHKHHISGAYMKESGEMGPVKNTKGSVLMKHKTSGKEINIINTPEAVKQHQARGYEKVSTVKKEEVELQEMSDMIDALIQEYESKGGTYRHKGTYGYGGKGAEHGETDYKKENDMAKAADKPAKKKYGSRQNYVRSTRVNESFTELLQKYTEGGVRSLNESLYIVEEADNDQFTAELEKAKKKDAGQDRNDKAIAAGATQSVKSVSEEVDQIDEAMSHQAATTMKHIKPGTLRQNYGDRKDAANIKPGISGVADRLAMLARAKKEGRLKEDQEQIDENLPMTSLKPGHDEKAARFLARQVKGTPVAGKAQSAPQKEGGMKKKVKEEVEQVDERQMTEPEMKKREEIVKSMKKGMAGFKQRYGERAKSVMYATATKQAMKD